ncbi:hypothetical protein PHYSODRAFT_330005 [Phytophthora sojae]|uniref:Uncharacterized protein n=1 Tax=Phytophthora sojae (strain P6497) TaxID=1094619 RepID=G4ZCC8_PHYSP|nr:hypothetical protein PHYSODRAFT_330005 [Phytophthora sojae]EGZ22156.1 hypothetical protein PHYSODRAFT_330005 [Phytophthora sojae]|eukprot:XP_009524873.1 hypothetical protein PHYSODRAFT_330005 [Phytophthora sojae]
MRENTCEAAFENVTGIGSTVLTIPKEEREAVGAFLYHNRSWMPPDVICTAFALRICASSKPEISRSVKQVALMFAARSSYRAVIQLLEKGEDWPLATLNEALKATSSPNKF